MRSQFIRIIWIFTSIFLVCCISVMPVFAVDNVPDAVFQWSNEEDIGDLEMPDTLNEKNDADTTDIASIGQMSFGEVEPISDDIFETISEIAPLAADDPDLIISVPKLADNSPYTEPLPLKKEISFQCYVANVKSEYAADQIPVSIYAADNLMLSGTIPNLPKNSMTQVEFGIERSKGGGTYTIKAVVNESRRVPESNYDNNIAKKDFTWSGGSDPNPDPAPTDIGLCAIDLGTYTTDNNGKPLYELFEIPTQPMVFTFKVGNTGLTNLSNVEMAVYLDNVMIPGSLYTIQSLPARKYYALNSSIFIRSSGKHTIKLVVDPNHKITSDENRKDNEIQKAYTLFYETVFLTQNGRWPSGSTIGIQLEENVLSQLHNVKTGDNFTLSDFNNAGNNWNKHLKQNIRFGDAVIGSQGKQVRVSCLEKNTSDQYIIATGKPSPWVGPYDSAQLTIYTSMFNDFTSKTINGVSYSAVDRATACITHELGHILGLGHNECLDPAIMSPGTNWANYSPIITNHDLNSLNARYK